MKTVFVRLIEAERKGEALQSALQDWKEDGEADGVYAVDARSFGKVPGSPFAYWVGDRVRDLFQELPPLASEGREVKQGLATAYDFRFLRLWWEVEPAKKGQGRKWVPFAKGGKYSPYYADIHLVVNWEEDGEELAHFDRSYIRNPDFYFRPGLTWPRRTQGGFSLRVMASGAAFGDKGPTVFTHGDIGNDLLALLAVGNSLPFRNLLSLQMAFGSYEVGVLGRTSIPPLEADLTTRLASLASEGWSNARTLDCGTHVSHAFTLPVIAKSDGSRLQESARMADVARQEVLDRSAAVQQAVDEAACDAYGEPSLREVSAEGAQSPASGLPEEDDDEDADEGVDPLALVTSLLEWTVGVAFGRFDIRLATGERPIPGYPDPFDPLPVCSPGMVQDEDGLPATASPSDYPVDVAWDGILVDDEGRPRDIVRHMRRVLGLVSGGHDWATEAEDILGRDLRDWVRRSLFDDHIKRYSKSRRKAPIFWRLGTPSGSYSVWLYYPRATGDTLYRVLNDYVGPKLRHEESTLLRLRQEAGSSPTASQQEGIEAQEELVSEVQDMKAELEVVAQLWKPEFDDGVVLNSAPFWRLVAHTRKWQKECKKHWGKLVKGEYDWSYTAMRLWPERVVPACTEDRSFAIAHGLEEEFFPDEREGDDGAASQVRESERIQELAEARGSAAVKQALQTLLRR